MPFNGSGTFTRLYSWVQDAANSIDILSTRMDNEDNGFATALSDCVTRDGQSPFTANIPAGGFKIVNHATPSSGTDVANKAYVDGVVQSEWKAETNSFAWVSATQFKLTGVNLTAIYHVGRRVKIVHNSGGSTAYATITATVFSTDTTVTVVTDDGSSLVSTLTAVNYGIISYVNPSYLDPRSCVLAYLSTTTSYPITSDTKVVFDSTLVDTLTEFSAGRFTAKHVGNYLVSVQVTVEPSAAGHFYLFIFKNGSVYAEQLTGVAPASGFAPFAMTALVALAAADYLEVHFGAAQGGTLFGQPELDTRVSIVRLP
jgi:hypothetical protein